MIEEEMRSLEARLALLKPSRPRLDRDRLMFLAGQASVAYWPRYRPSAARPAAISAVLAAAATFLVMTAIQSGARVADRVASAVPVSVVSPGAAGVSSRSAASRRAGAGDSLGWAVSMLTGKVSLASDSPQVEQGVLSLRQKLLNESRGAGREAAGSKENAPEPAAGRPAATEESPGRTSDEKRSLGAAERPCDQARRLGARPSPILGCVGQDRFPIQTLTNRYGV